MPLQESGENYLETILQLEKRLELVRSVDVANELGFSKASISRAMKILKDAQYISIQKDGGIRLTELGRQRAQSIFERHELIARYLVMTLGLSPSIAEKDACRIEHILSDETFGKIRDYVRKNA